MSKAIFKYVLVSDTAKHRPVIPCTFTMPPGAEVLSIGLDPGKQLCLWALCNNQDERRESRSFVLVWTGEHIPMRCRAFVGTVTCGNFVYHCFEAVQE